MANKSTSGTPYLVHKIGKQIAFKALFTVGTYHRMEARYKTNVARYLRNPNDDIFRLYGRSGQLENQSPATFIYRETHPIGRTLRSYLAPTKLKEDSPPPTKIRSLEGEGYSTMSHYSRAMQLANMCRLAGDVGAFTIGSNQNGNPSNRLEKGAVILDGLSTVAWSGYHHYKLEGNQAIRAAKDTSTPMDDATRQSLQREGLVNYQTAEKWMIGAYGFQIATGLLKVGIEINHYRHDPKSARWSALSDGAADIGEGVSNVQFGLYLLRKSSNVENNGHLRHATDVLSIGASPIPKNLLSRMRFFGMAGPAISLVTSSLVVYDGCTNQKLDAKEATHEKVSGALGIASSLFFMGQAFFITPASYPIGAACLCAGSLLLMGQTLYDEWDGIKTLLA